MGSGHILVYMFDVLLQIYQAYGYSTREAVQSILQNNLYGLDIDDRAAQLAYFAVMMKARQVDRRFFSRGIQPHVHAIAESGDMPQEGFALFGPQEDIARRVYAAFVDAKEYGSLIEPDVTPEELDALQARLCDMDGMATYGSLSAQAITGAALNVICPLMEQARVLAQKYDVVVTNPPYMSSSGMSAQLSSYAKRHYPNTKSDMFSVFMEKCLFFAKPKAFVSMITQTSWMFLSTFEKFRNQIIDTTDIICLAHLGVGTFVDLNSKVVQSVSFSLRKGRIPSYRGIYDRLFEREGFYEDNDEKAKWLITGKHRFYSKQTEFKGIPGAPIAYWLSQAMFKAFEAPKLKDIAKPLLGLFTYDNERFLRLWFEVNSQDIDFCLDTFDNQTGKWLPHNKGGKFRRWYGNLEYIVWYKDHGKDVKCVGIVNNEDGYLARNITWSAMSTVNNPFRLTPIGTSFDSNKGPFIHNNKNDDIGYLLGFLNTKIAGRIFGILNPTISLQNGDLDRVPIILCSEKKAEIEAISYQNVDFSKTDWDSFETSWDFREHPFIRWASSMRDATSIGCLMKRFYGNTPDVSCPLELCFLLWQGECNERFAKLKANEEELNRIFIDIYGQQDELTPEVEDKDVTVRRADLGRDIRSFISYAVGCMFGRYSLDRPGLAYAGGAWDDAAYTIALAYTWEPFICEEGHQ